MDYLLSRFLGHKVLILNSVSLKCGVHRSEHKLTLCKGEVVWGDSIQRLSD